MNIFIQNCFEISTKNAQDSRKIHILKLKIALCGLRWFKLNVSKYQKDVKLSKRCEVVKKMSNVKK